MSFRRCISDNNNNNNNNNNNICWFNLNYPVEETYNAPL